MPTALSIEEVREFNSLCMHAHFLNCLKCVLFFEEGAISLK